MYDNRKCMQIHNKSYFYILCGSSYRLNVLDKQLLIICIEWRYLYPVENNHACLLNIESLSLEFSVPLNKTNPESAVIGTVRAQFPSVLDWLMCDWSTDWYHDDVIKWKHFPCYWPFVWGMCWSPVNSSHRGQWHGALMFSMICAWING